MLTEAQAAAYVGLPVATFLRAVDRRELPPARQLAGRRRWSRPEIERTLDDPLHAPIGQGSDPLMDAIERMGSKA